MAIVADITVPAASFAPALAVLGAETVEFERVVPVAASNTSMFWVSNVAGNGAAGRPDGGVTLDDGPGLAGSLEASLRARDGIARVTCVAESADRLLFEVEWAGDTGVVLRALERCQAAILEATGNGQVWDLRLWFNSHEDLATFNGLVTADGVPVTLRRLSSPANPNRNGVVSDRQAKALTLALERGYFEVPRRVTIGDLADDLNVSDSAVSQRLRRGLSLLVRDALVLPD